MDGVLRRLRFAMPAYSTRPRIPISLSATIITAVCLLPSFSEIAHSEVDRIALVLAAEKYDHFSPSSVTADTGQKIADAIKGRGFDVTFVKNPSDAVARAALRDFAQRATGANAAIVVLAGHGVSFDGRSYFLPINAEITRDSDLLSRGLAVPSVAGIVARAKFGGVFFFMSVAPLPSTMQSVTARPSFANQLQKNVVVTFSTSDKIPVSQVDRVTEEAATDFIRGVNSDPFTAATLVHAGLAGGEGQVFGSIPELDLSKPLKSTVAAAPPPVAASQTSSLEADQRAKEAEDRAKDIEMRAKEAEDQARAEAQEAQARAREAEARASEAEAKARTAVAAAESTIPASPPAPAPAPTVAPAASDEIKSLTTVEELFGNAQRMRIQLELKKRDLYKGEIDSIFGDLTRDAIRAYQKSRGDTMTGYLTPQQLQSLVGS